MMMTRTNRFGRRAGRSAAAALLALATGIGGGAAMAQDAGAKAGDGGVAGGDAVRPMAPVGVRGIVAARPFRVETAFPHTWRAEQPEVTGGWLLVLEVDPQLVFPRQTAMPVLYAGRETAARVNVGYESGRLIVIVPDRLTKDGTPATALADLPIWFGDANLPERITAEGVAAARAAADAAGITARPESERTAATARGVSGVVADDDGVVTYEDRMALMMAAMRLVKQHAPDETELADGWLILEQP